ncbi:MAG: glycosyltransferase [Rhodobacterales bacterium]|nr:glycosyltransferase [Rhodobacterales bacterium]MDX5412267.1 glycosyltransferase [Rhodobacterales bacterium]
MSHRPHPARMPDAPLISVLMANLNGAAYIRHAIRSVLRQTHDRLELIIADDGSTDASCTIIREEMDDDPRIHLLEGGASRGPAGAQNRALAAASGDWIAIVDSDDITHPERFTRLLDAARRLEADVVADDIIFFGDDPLERNRTLLQDFHLDQPLRIDAVTLVTGCLRGHENTSLGYLKPLIRRAALGDIRFNESLLIDEDHDLYLRLVLSGAAFFAIPDAMYLYRRHSGSASYRQSVAKLCLMIAAQEHLLQQVPPDQPDLAHAVAQRLRHTRDQLEYGEIVEAITAGDRIRALRLLARRPKCLPFLLQSLTERTMRGLRRPPPTRSPLKIVLGARGRARQADYPGARIIPVPDVPETGWMPSAAATWGHLSDLSCAHDLDIVALDRAGTYALGLVPQWHRARVHHPEPGPAQDHSRPVIHAEGT